MRISVVGTGGIGTALAKLFVRSGQHVSFASREPRNAGRLAEALGAQGATSYQAAARSCDLLVFCIPWEHSVAVLGELGDLHGRVLLDPSNPEATDGRSLVIGHASSGAEMIAARSGAHVVKAFNYVYAELISDSDALARVSPSIFFCTDHPPSGAAVSGLIRDCGLEPVDCGPLRNARYLEPLALLMVQLVRERGYPQGGVAMRLVQSCVAGRVALPATLACG